MRFVKSGRELAQQYRTDLECERVVESLRRQEPSGNQAFALLLACIEVQKFADLRLLLSRPLKDHLLDLGPGRMHVVIAKILALRGAQLRSDLATLRSHGIVIDGFKEAVEFKTNLTRQQYPIFRARITDIKPRGRVTEVRVDEVVRYATFATVFFLGGVTEAHTTGQIAWARTEEDISEELLNKEVIVLLKVVHGGLRDKIILGGAYPIEPLRPDILNRQKGIMVDTEELEVVRFSLENGLKVVLHPNTLVPVVHVAVSYDAGARRERPDLTGLAHMVEHMMFEGSRHIGRGEHFRLLEERGAFLVNAITTVDYAYYFETVPSSELALALWLEADRMAFLEDGLREEGLTRQRRIVLNERDLRISDSPYGVADAAMAEYIYGKKSALSGHVIGRPEDIERIQLSDVRAFYKAHYGPSSATLIVAGDFDVQNAKRLINTYFTTLPAQPAPGPVSRPGFEPPTSITRVSVPHARHTRVSVIWPGPRAFSDEAAALDMVSHVLDDGGWGMLREFLEAGGVDVVSAHVSLKEQLDSSTFEQHVIVANPAQAELCANLMRRTFARVQLLGLTNADLITLAGLLEQRILYGLQSLEQKADMLKTFEVYQRGPQPLTQAVRRYYRISPELFDETLRETQAARPLVCLAEPGKRNPRKAP